MFEPDVSNYLVVLFCVLILRSEIRIDPLLSSKNQRLNLTLYSYLFRDVLFEYHRAIVPFCWAVRPVRSLSTV